jgi:hypothetical protein
MKFVIFAVVLARAIISCGLNLPPALSISSPDLPSSIPSACPSSSGCFSKSRPVTDIHALIQDAAKKHRVPPELVSSIVAVESGFIWDAVSPKGAVGFMQLMPETAREYGADPTDPEQNVDAGTHYLRVLLDRYYKHSNSMVRAIAAYNAGPTVVDRYHGVPPFPETRQYVARVLRFLRLFQRERLRAKVDTSTSRTKHRRPEFIAFEQPHEDRR